MYRLLYIFMIPVIIFTAAACSGTSQTSRPTDAAQDSVSRDSNAAPAWFNEETVAYDNKVVTARAAAIGSDSVTVEKKAVSRAVAKLKQSVSDRLETVRTEAIQELGKGSGLADPGFLIDFRKANSVVDDIVATQQTSAAAVEGQNSFRGFAEVQVDRTELTGRMGEQLTSYEETWNALLKSAAFEKF